MHGHAWMLGELQVPLQLHWEGHLEACAWFLLDFAPGSFPSAAFDLETFAAINCESNIPKMANWQVIKPEVLETPNRQSKALGIAEPIVKKIKVGGV